MFKTESLAALLLCVCVLWIPCPVSGQPLSHAYSKTLANPVDFIVVGDGRVVVLDPVNDSAALSLIDVRDGRVLVSHRLGKGPGEIPYDGEYALTRRANGEIWLWSSQSRVLNIYNEDLGFEAALKVDGSSAAVVPVGESEALRLPRSFGDDNPYAILHEVGKEYRLGASTVVTADAYTELDPLSDHPMLRQGPVYVSGNTVFIGYSFSSAVVHVEDGEITGLASDSDEFPFPNFDSKVKENGKVVHQAPDVTKHPIVTTDLALDASYLYALRHGRKFHLSTVKRIFRAVRWRMEEAIEDWELTDTVVVYDRQNMQRLKSFTLPVRARKIEVHGSSLYVMTIDGGPPRIEVYDKNNLLSDL
jgi:hypothetical protein